MLRRRRAWRVQRFPRFQPAFIDHAGLAVSFGVIAAVLALLTFLDQHSQEEHLATSAAEVQFQKEYQEQRAKELADPKSYPVPVEQPIVHEPDVQADETSEMQKKFEFELMPMYSYSKKDIAL